MKTVCACLVSGWFPMDTAPKDGTRILAHETGVVDRAYWDHGRHGWYSHGTLWYPTEWMPLPNPPADDAADKTRKKNDSNGERRLLDD